MGGFCRDLLWLADLWLCGGRWDGWIVVSCKQKGGRGRHSVSFCVLNWRCFGLYY